MGFGFLYLFFPTSDLLSVVLQPGRGWRPGQQDAGFQPDHQADVSGGRQRENGEPALLIDVGEGCRPLPHVCCACSRAAPLAADPSRKTIDGSKCRNTSP